MCMVTTEQDPVAVTDAYRLEILLGPPPAYYHDPTSGSYHKISHSIANLPIMDCELAPLPAVRDRLGNLRTDTTAICVDQR